MIAAHQLCSKSLLSTTFRAANRLHFCWMWPDRLSLQNRSYCGHVFNRPTWNRWTATRNSGFHKTN